MTTEEHDDNNWLEALAGRPVKDIDPVAFAQANAVRQALAARRAAIEADAAQPDPKQLERLRQRLLREGLLTPAKVNAPATGWQRLLAGLGLRGGSGGSSTLVAARWAVLAFAVVAVFVALRVGMPVSGQDPAIDVLRGGTASVLIVQDPQVRLTELRQGLLAVKAVFTDKTLSDGRVQMDIQANESALEYLQSQRITPTVKDGSVRIVIQKKP